MIDYKNMLEKIKKNSPIVHHITNYVTVRDCANITLAIGASPIMSDEILDAPEIVSLASAFVINLGTMRESTFNSALKTGKEANKLGIPIVFDPVGAGASKFRNTCANKFLSELKIDVIKGNLSEICFLSGESFKSAGVDVSEEDENKDTKEIVRIARKLSEKTNAVVVATGKTDVIVKGQSIYICKNGHEWLKRITGTGCMTASLMGSFVGGAENSVESVAMATALMGIAGELAYEKTKDKGTASFGVSLIDEVSMMDAKKIEEKLRLEKYEK